MLTALTLPLVGILLAFPFPGFNTIKALRNKPAAPLDSLPPPWKPASRLALENEFVRAALPSLGPRVGALRVANDPRRLRISVQPDSGVLTAAPEVGDVRLGNAPRLGLAEFTREMSRRNFERLWRERSLSNINSAGTGAALATPHSGISIVSPIALPKQVSRFLGPGSPALNISGSENIKLSGTSEWTNQETGLLGQRRSLFPSLDMQQDLDIRLEGQLSDRVRVNLLQNSANQIPLANRIAINYKGDEDDLVQSLDLGNTNLALPGTQYVSYSGKNEGLFGVKASSRMGPIDFTILASKQEGRSERAAYQGGASRQTQGIYDKDYIKGVYFFLHDPNRDPPNTAEGVHVENIIESSIRVYQDDAIYANLANTDTVRAYVDPTNTDPDSVDSPYVRGIFKQLKADAEDGYEILTNVYGPQFPVIRLTRQLTGEKRLAVSYRWLRGTGDTVQVGGDETSDPLYQTPTLRLKLIRPAQQDLTLAPTGFFDTTNAFDRIRDLELKNFYQLGGQMIDRKSFEMQIHYGDFQPYRTSVDLNGQPIPYIEVVGLDNFDETGGFVSYDRKDHDGKVDGTGPQANYRVFLDDVNGVLFLPDLRPFDPQLSTPFQRVVVNPNLLRRVTLEGAPNSGTEPNPEIYDKRTVLSNDRLYTIDVTFTAARASGEITLGRSNLVEGSDVVTINGQPLRRDVDYRIDYDLGKVTLIRQLGPSDQVNVDYAYAPLFQQAGKTLLGSAFRYEGRDRNVGGAFLYESKGQQELRPRIGEEPSRVLIGDLNTEWTFRPEWMTRLVDRLPGVRTTAASELLIGAEAGASFPNPNTRNEVFVDDMEGVRDAVSLSMGPDRWRWSSVPIRTASLTIENPGLPDFQKNAEIHWFSPLTSVKERDLKPTLTDAEGAQNSRQVLALSLPRRPSDETATTQPLWAGLTYPLDAAGIDLSRSQFIEIWVNDFADFHRGFYEPRVRSGAGGGGGVKLHIDLGTVSEDQRRAPNVPPNGLLDSEDLPPQDNQLTVVGDNNEDTGYDNQLGLDEDSPPSGRPDLSIVPDLVTVVPGQDPRGDDFDVPGSERDFTDLDPRKWVRTNGPEDNKNLTPIPETEDLNLNRSLDLHNNYFEYTIDLGDTSASARYLVTDVNRSFDEFTGSGGGFIPPDNGWRRYRIPIADEFRTRVGAPDLSLARQVRIWLEDVVLTDPLGMPNASEGRNDGRPLVMIGGLEIVGSRWLATDLDSASVSNATTVTLNSVNTIENADIYTPPFIPDTRREGNQAVQLREQSLALEFEQLRPGGTVEAFKTFSLDEDYSRYGSLNWYIASFRPPAACAATYDTLDFFVRFSSDERGTSYYEYRSRVPVSTVPKAITWQNVVLKLTDISNLKLNADFPTTGDIFYSAPGKNPGETYIVRGRPSFTRLRRVAIGVLNTTGTSLPCGQLWFDEVRATDIVKESGYAQRVDVRGRLANLLTYSVNYGGRDANFQSVGESRGSGNQTSNINVTTSFNLHQFFEATGIVLPLSFGYQTGRATPRYSAGDDVVRTGAIAAASETRTNNRSFSTSYTRTWSDKSNPFLRYTLGGIGASLSMTEGDNSTPSTVSSAKSLGAAVNYRISPRRLLEIPVPRTKLKLYPLPESFNWDYGVGTSRVTAYNRLLDSTSSLTLLYDTQGRTGHIDFGASTRPIDAFHHRFLAQRNLTLPSPLLEQIGFINLGRVVRWNQSMDTRFAPQKFGAWVRPVLSWNSNYYQDNGPALSPDLSVRQISNGQTLTLNWDLPFDKLVSVAQRTAAPAAARDTLRRGPPPSPGWRRFLSRLGAITTDATLTRNSTYTRLTGTPDFFYLAGLTRDPGVGDRMTEEFGNRSDNGQTWRAGARTRLELGLGAAVGTRFAINATEGTSNGVTNRRREMRFPDLEVTYGRVVDVIGLRRILNNPQLNTTYYQTSSREFSNSEDPTTISGTTYWQPLLRVSGDLKNGTRTELRVERRTTKTENRLFGSSVTTDRNTDVNLSLSRSYTQGQKVNVLGKETTVRTSVNLGLTGSYQRHTGETLQSGFTRPQSEVKTDRLSVNGNGSYGFSNNVTGNVELGFGQNRDLRIGSVSRSIRIELRAQFTF